MREHWLASNLTRLRAPQPVSEREQQLLADVAAHPICPITTRYERLGWNPKIGNALKEQLLTKGLATFEPVTTPTGQVKILRLITRSRTLLTNAGITVPGERGGGAAHEYWKHTIADRLRRQGFSVTEEYPIGDGRAVDLHATRGNERRFVEVETGRSDIIANGKKCAELRGDVTFVFTDPRKRDEYAPKLRTLLPAAGFITTAELHEFR